MTLKPQGITEKNKRLRAALAKSDDSKDDLLQDLTLVSDLEGTLVCALIPTVSLNNPSLTLLQSHRQPTSLIALSNPSCIQLTSNVATPPFT